jgi:predicted ribosomally synthesized peptide with SipW-like signal peptide
MNGTEVRRPRRHRNTKRVLMSLGILGLMAGVGSIGTYALFSASSATGNNTFATANLSITNDKSASSVLSLSNMVPGDTVTGIVNVTNAGGEDLTAYDLATSVTSTANALTLDTTSGLKVWVERCSAAWTGAGTPSTATCGSTRTDVGGTSSGTYLAIAPTSGTSGSFSLIANGNAFCIAGGSLAAERTARGTTCDTSLDTAGIDHLRVHVSFPSTAGNTSSIAGNPSFLNQSATIVFSFTGQQPTAHGF